MWVLSFAAVEVARGICEAAIAGQGTRCGLSASGRPHSALDREAIRRIETLSLTIYLSQRYR